MTSHRETDCLLTMSKSFSLGTPCLSLPVNRSDPIHQIPLSLLSPHTRDSPSFVLIPKLGPSMTRIGISPSYPRGLLSFHCFFPFPPPPICSSRFRQITRSFASPLAIVQLSQASLPVKTLNRRVVGLTPYIHSPSLHHLITILLPPIVD